MSARGLYRSRSASNQHWLAVRGWFEDGLIFDVAPVRLGAWAPVVRPAQIIFCTCILHFKGSQNTFYMYYRGHGRPGKHKIEVGGTGAYCLAARHQPVALDGIKDLPFSTWSRISVTFTGSHQRRIPPPRRDAAHYQKRR